MIINDYSESNTPWRVELTFQRRLIAELQKENKELEAVFDECYEELGLVQHKLDKSTMKIAELEAKLAKAMRNQRGKPMDYPDPRPWDGRMIMYTKPSN